MVGHLAATHLYLIPDAVYRYVVHAARDANSVFPVDAITLKKALAEAKLIETVTTNGTVRYTIQKRVGAAKPYVLDLKLDALVFTRDSEDKPEKKTESKTPQPIDFLGSYEEKSPLSSLSSKITGEGEGGACISRVTCAKEKDAEGVSFLNKKNEDSEDNYKNTPINTSGNPVFTRQETVKMNEAREGTRKKASKPPCRHEVKRTEEDWEGNAFVQCVACKKILETQ